LVIHEGAVADSSMCMAMPSYWPSGGHLATHYRHRLSSAHSTALSQSCHYSILEFVSSQFPMYDADLGKNQSFNEFCRGFCQANEPVRMFYPNFFGVEMEEDGRIKAVSVVALTFRAEKHPSWTDDMVKQWEIDIDEYFASNYDQRRIDVNVASYSILERGIVIAGESLRPFLVIGFLIMCIFCTSTTLASSVVMYHHRATFKKVVLSVTACVVPFMACGTAFGAIFLIGVTNSPILHVTPFLEYPRLKEATQRFLRWYTRLVADVRFSLMVVLVWIVFVAGAIV
ncbi:hypothetical protein TELCIR_14430, partial [Teladorsagia circumcincta]